MGYTTAYVFVFIFALLCEAAVSRSCASISSSGYASAQRKPKGFGSAKRAVIIGMDGFGGSHFRNSTNHYPTLRSFIEQGSYTTRARGVFPTKSGANWVTSLTGLSVMQHGVFSNQWSHKNGDPSDETSYSVPPITGRGLPKSIFTEVKKKDQKLQTAMMFTWELVKYFACNNSDIDVWHWGGDGVTCDSKDPENCYHQRDLKTMRAATANLVRNKPILTFIHLDMVDFAGHATCWGCTAYYRALKSVEMKIKILLDTLKNTKGSNGKSMLDGTLIVIISDHGGWKNHHNYRKPFSALVDIPILIRGPCVLKNNSLENTFVSILDVVPTVLNAIGVEKSEFMRGQVLQQIYH